MVTIDVPRTWRGSSFPRRVLNAASVWISIPNRNGLKPVQTQTGDPDLILNLISIRRCCI